MLAQLEERGRLSNVHRVKSDAHVGIQVTDLLTGAINASHQRWLDNNRQIHPGKLLTIHRLAELIGWDELWYDTYPSSRLNIWHFPPEYRATPETRAVTLAPAVRYVTPAEMRGV